MTMPVPRVIGASSVSADTGQTRGILRRAAIDSTATSARRIWMGTALLDPRTASAPHHHGEAETAVYCLAGTLRVYFGEAFGEHIDVEPGEFAFIPPFVQHIEANEGDVATQTVFARSPDNIVVNL